MGLVKSRVVTKMEHALNALGTCGVLNMFYLGPFESVLLTVVLLLSPLWPLMILYLLWIYYDRETPQKDGRRVKWIRQLPMFQRFRNYFPQKIIKTADLSPEENHMLCVFPHGILCTGALSQFTSENPAFESLFPGIEISCHTLNSNFWFPFSREYVMAIGLTAVSKEALVYQLSKPKGRGVALVVGGSAEAMISSPGTHRIILKNRKGFVKLAITTGTNLVPIYIFGETDLYTNYMFPENSIIYKAQEAFRKFTGVAPVLVNGGGIFQPYFGLLPRPYPVFMVVGKPIHVEKKENPSREDVNNLHNVFIQELVNLFEEQKYKYLAKPESAHLSIE